MANQNVNYLTQHQEACRRLIDDDVSAIDLSIYNALFLIWNESKWADKLSINRTDVMNMAKVGNKNTYTASLKKLHDKGYIKYCPSNNPLIGSIVTITTFGTSGRNGITKYGKASGKGGGKASGKGGGTLYKHFKQIETIETIKTIKALTSAYAEVERLGIEISKKNEKIQELKSQIEEERKKASAEKKKEDEVMLPFTSDDFHQKWSAWKAYKKSQHKFTYRSASSEQAALIKLTEISNGLEETALLIIKESIANGWQGLFPLKNNQHGQQNSNPKQSGEGLNADYKRQLAERLANATSQGGNNGT